MESNRKIVFSFDSKLCKGCGICFALCPKSVFSKDIDNKPIFAHNEQCICCGMCEQRCPDFAIRIRRNV